MAPTPNLTTLPALRRQNLLAEFAGLKQACPAGVFVTLTPGDPALWSGVLFVRRGPYAPAVLRFQISFPDAYPQRPPLVTFSTDLFHPLLTPLSAYTYTTDITDAGTVSATDDERLPPGGFSLRHGFPAWFGRGAASAAAAARRASQRLSSQSGAGSSAAATPPRRPQTPPPQASDAAAAAAASLPSTPASSAAAAAASTPSYLQTRAPAAGQPGAVATYDVLRYIRSAFDDEAVLDAVPLEAAGNPGAWHAWRAHRRQQGRAGADATTGTAPSGTAPSGTVSNSTAIGGTATGGTATSDPGEWNWEHVWEERVEKGIRASLSDPVLYGSAGAADDVIRFLSMEDGDIESVKDNLKRTLGVSAS